MLRFCQAFGGVLGVILLVALVLSTMGALYGSPVFFSGLADEIAGYSQGHFELMQLVLVSLLSAFVFGVWSWLNRTELAACMINVLADVFFVCLYAIKNWRLSFAVCSATSAVFVVLALTGVLPGWSVNLPWLLWLLGWIFVITTFLLLREDGEDYIAFVAPMPAVTGCATHPSGPVIGSSDCQGCDLECVSPEGVTSGGLYE